MDQGRQFLMSKYIDERYGPGAADKLLERSKEIRKYTNEELITLSHYYKKKVDELSTKHC
jgi:hypothetical protein